MKKIKEFIPPFKHNFDKKEIKEVVATLKSDWITTGPKVKKFEDKLAKYLKVKQVVAVNSCTAALHLSLIALDIKEDDEVITTPFTFVSTVNVILYQKAKPIFVDIKEDTYNIDSKKIEEKITKKTRAIIPVHYAGQPCDLDKILSIARKYNLAVIEDAAHAIGAEYRGKKIGGFGDTTCFSFYATKNLTTGEGGAIATNSDRLAEKLRCLRLHGMSKDAWKRYSSTGSWFYEIKELGYKYNMTDIQASLGIHQLKRLEQSLKIRTKYAQIYTKAFKNIFGLTTPYIKDNIHHAWHLYPIQVHKRDKFIEKLKAKKIGTSVHFIPVHLHLYYQRKFGFKRGDFPVAERVYNKIVSLPLYPGLTNEEIKYIIQTVKEEAK